MFGRKCLNKVSPEKLLTILILFALNCFKILFNIYFETKYLKKSREENFAQYQVFMYNFLRENDQIFIEISGLYKVFMWQNLLVHYR